MIKVLVYVLILVFATMLVKGFVDSSPVENHIYDPNYESGVDVFNDNKTEVSLDEKAESINKGHFYSCRDIADYCNRNPVLGCQKYCGY